MFPHDFDFIWLYSVWSHLLPGQIVDCAKSLLPMLKRGGKMLVSANIDEEYVDKGPHKTRPNERVSVRYPLEMLQSTLKGIAHLEVVEQGLLRQTILRVGCV